MGLEGDILSVYLVFGSFETTLKVSKTRIMRGLENIKLFSATA